MHPAKQLLQLQTLDLERDAKHRRLKQVVASLVEPETLRGAESTVARAQTDLDRARKLRQDLELEIQSLDAKIASVDERLYGGRVKNPKELADLQNDAASLRRRHATLDNTLLEAMIAVEEAEGAQKAAKSEQAALWTRWETEQKTLIEERHQLETDIATLTTRRNQMMAGIAPENLQPYQKLRHEHAGLAVARLENDVCGVCGEEISDRLLAKAKTSDNLSYCGNCGRILAID